MIRIRTRSMVSGSDLVSGAHDLKGLLIHHIWLTTNDSNSSPPQKFNTYVDSWGQKTPGAVCVQWRDRMLARLSSAWEEPIFSTANWWLQLSARTTSECW